MNSKGQVLVVFIILLPLILLFVSLIIDVGVLYSEKRNVDNNVKSTIEYGLKHIEKDNTKKIMSDLLKENIDDIDSLYIDIQNSKITVTLVKKQRSIFNLKQSSEIRSSYVGYIKEDKIKLIKEVK